MFKIIINWFLLALFLLLLGYWLPGFGIDNLYIALIAVVVLGAVNAFLKPGLVLLTLPINLLTLGLFTLVINGLLFWLVSTFLKGFEVAGFWPAFWAALIYSVFATFLQILESEPDKF